MDVHFEASFADHGRFNCVEPERRLADFKAVTGDCVEQMARGRSSTRSRRGGMGDIFYAVASYMKMRGAAGQAVDGHLRGHGRKILPQPRPAVLYAVVLEFFVMSHQIQNAAGKSDFPCSTWNRGDL